MENLTKGEQTRKEILLAAHQLFTEQGYHGTSMRQISDKANITLGGIYNHFSGKEDIFVAAIIEFHPLQTILPQLQTIKEDDIETAFHTASKIINKSLENRNDFFNLLFIELVEFKAAHLSSLFDNLFPKGLEIVNQISANNDQVKDYSRNTILASFMGITIAYYTYTNLIMKQSNATTDPIVYQDMIEILMHGILKEETEG